MRKRLRRHITIFLTGIFIFPVAFQHWHMKHQHSWEEHLQSCEYDHSHDHEKKDHGNDNLKHGHEPHQCLVCDYPFQVKDLPESVPVIGIVSRVIILEAEFPDAAPVVPDFRSVTPRAPPVA